MTVSASATATATSLPATMHASAQAAQASGGAGQKSDSGSFFDELLDIVNPLQHLPVIGTLYRAITGDKIDDGAQLAGDTLYGGLVGFGSSIANLIFKDITGKDFGDTVLAWVEGDGSDKATAVADAQTTTKTTTAPSPTATAVATAAPAIGAAANTADTTQNQKPLAPAAVTPAQATMLTDPAALMAAFDAKGIDPALGMRAMQAYEKTLGLNAQP